MACGYKIKDKDVNLVYQTGDVFFFADSKKPSFRMGLSEIQLQNTLNGYTICIFIAGLNKGKCIDFYILIKVNFRAG